MDISDNQSPLGLHVLRGIVLLFIIGHLVGGHLFEHHWSFVHWRFLSLGYVIIWLAVLVALERLQPILVNRMPTLPDSRLVPFATAGLLLILVFLFQFDSFAYGGGNLGMGSIQGMNTDLIYQWPIVEMGVMGVSQTVDLFFGPFLQQADDPVKAREEKIKEFRDVFVNPLNVASYSPYTDDIIEPRETRRVLIRSLRLLANKKVTRYSKRHGNIPL